MTAYTTQNPISFGSYNVSAEKTITNILPGKTVETFSDDLKIRVDTKLEFKKGDTPLDIISP